MTIPALYQLSMQTPAWAYGSKDSCMYADENEAGQAIQGHCCIESVQRKAWGPLANQVLSNQNYWTAANQSPWLVNQMFGSYPGLRRWGSSGWGQPSWGRPVAQYPWGMVPQRPQGGIQRVPQWGGQPAGSWGQPQYPGVPAGVYPQGVYPPQQGWGQQPVYPPQQQPQYPWGVVQQQPGFPAGVAPIGGGGGFPQGQQPAIPQQPVPQIPQGTVNSRNSETRNSVNSRIRRIKFPVLWSSIL